MINIAIRATYFCFVLFLFLFFFLIIQFQAAFFKLPIHSEIYNCTFKNTNKVSIIIIIIIIIIIVIIIIIIIIIITILVTTGPRALFSFFLQGQYFP